MRFLLLFALALVLLPSGAHGEEVCKAGEACDGLVKGVEIGSEKTQKDFYDRAAHYELVWGGRMRPGFFPHLAHGGLIAYNISQAADALTERMVELAGINHTSIVLDLGCGMGQACRMIAELTGAYCMGLDLSTTNIVKAKKAAADLPHLRAEYVEGSFTNLPPEVTSKKFTHIFSQVAFVHVHKLLPEILQQAQKVLAPGGVMVVNDYLGGDGAVSEETQEHVYKRLHFDQILGPKMWRRTVDDAGLVLLHYENLRTHMAESYSQAADKADLLGFKSTDGSPLGDNYRGTVRAIKAGEIGMNLALLAPE